MRHLLSLRWLLALLAGLGSLLPAHATHVKGGDISYRPLTPTTTGLARYHVTVRLFVDPAGFQQNTVELAVTRGACNGNDASNFSVKNIPRSQTIIGSTLGCTGFSYLCNINLFETDIALTSGQWTLSITSENRVAGIQNIANPIQTNLYLSTYLNTELTTNDSSPAFSSTLLPYVGTGANQRYSFSAFDADGDSLAYGFTPSQQVPGGIPIGGGPVVVCPVPIAGSFSPHFTLDPRTGDLTRVPGANQQGYFVMAARVSEYRRLAGQWQLLGYVTRDILYLAYASSNQAPYFSALAVNGGASQSPDLPIAVRPGQTVQLTLTATDPDAGQQLRFVSDAPGIVPGLSLATLSGTQAQLTWQVPATLPPGRYPVPVAVLDNGCPINASEARTLVFVVSNQALAAQPAFAAPRNAYPAPFREQVQLTAAPGQAVIITDALGREVARLQAAADGRVQWLPTDLPAGIYLARTIQGQLLARLLHAE